MSGVVETAFRRIDWAADVLRGAGLTVQEEDGWKTRGVDFRSSPVGVVIHHDGAEEDQEHPTFIINGGVQSGGKKITGPLSQFYLNRQGRWHLVASGKANHAGRCTGWYNGLTTATGNWRLLGVEAAHMPDEEWTEVQLDAYAKGVAAILRRLGAPSLMAFGHKEWTTRKTDPAFGMAQFRARVRTAMLEGWPPFPGVEQRRQVGARGTAPEYVRKQLQKLGIVVDLGDSFDAKLENAVKRWQTLRGLKRKDGVVDRDTWESLAILDYRNGD